jgi:hypothetical protein
MSDIEQILYPTVLSDLKEDTPPVQCIVWKGNEEYETIAFDNVYPFDTIDDIKRFICAHYNDPAFIPRFVFVGVPIGDDAYSTEKPTLASNYIPLEWLWYPTDTNDPKATYILKNPRKTLTEPDMRFVTAEGSYASPNIDPRGRSTIEKVFLKPRQGKIPVFHIFPIKYLLREYNGPTPIAEEDWNKRFAPYYPFISVDGPYEPDDEDIELSEKIDFYVKQRERTLNKVNNLLLEGVDVPSIKVTGIRQLRLTWKKPVKGFEGCGYFFYRLPVTKQRPYLRLMPSEGSAVTKLHVDGVLPIPTLEDPRILEVWGKEVSPTPGIDFCSLKYIHRPSIGNTQAIYGTVQVCNDGTMNLLLLPPKQIKKLDPNLDFRNFNQILENVFTGLPQPIESFELGEIAVLFALKTGIKSKKFNKTRLQQRLPYFQTFFTEIKPLPNESPIISLRYKAVPQYATEDKIFSFLTQYTTSKSLDGESLDASVVIALQDEFQLSKQEAIDYYADWFKRRGAYTVSIPEDGEFIESLNPGIDIHIYAQHPSYYCHINRIDSYETYIRIYTILSLLFIEEDEYFSNVGINKELSRVSEELEQESLKREEGIEAINRPNEAPVEQEETAAAASTTNQIKPKDGTIASVPDWMMDDPFANESDAVNVGEVIPETAPTAVQAATVPQEAVAAPKKRPQVAPEVVANKAPLVPLRGEDEQRLVNPKSWFIKKLQEIDSRLFAFKVEDSDDNGYSRKCAGYDDRQPSILTKDQYERMREIYEDDPIFWIVYPLEGTDNPVQPLGTEETVTLMRYGSDQEAINYYFCPQYYCLSDEIMVREKDFEGTQDREGNPKPPNTCPFCLGKLITDNKKAIPGYTVIKRKDKKGSTAYHSEIDFMSKTTHPEGFALPCCFLKQSTLRISDPQFSHLRDYLQQTAVDEVNANEVSENTEEQEYEELIFRGDEAIEYAVLFESLQRKYILESNKHPDPGIFAAVPYQFDKFFRQDSNEKIITRVAIHLKLRPNATGFLRIGTENTIYESLLGVIAPLIYKNSINEVKERILEVVTPRIFLNSHFGNLVLEFYNPADGSAMPPTKQELMSWASTQLGVALSSTNLYQLLRIYNAYKRFIKFIRDPRQRKDLRHIQPLLAEPGLFTTRGIQLIVMEDNGNEPVTVKCPTFGVSIDRNKKNDFAFISRSLKYIGASENVYARYELYLHTSNKPAKGGEGEIHETIIRWDYASRRYWPEIVQRRVDEYMTQCQSRYRSIYTSQDGVNSMAMIPLSKAVDAAPFRPEGIIKDSYNHIVGLTFRSKPGSSTLVALPIVDDGVISISSAFAIKSIYLDWDDYKVAPVDDVVNYYRKNLEPLFALYPGYIVKYIVKQKLDNKIVAVQLENGLYIPAGQPKDESVIAGLGLDTVTIEEFQWQIDKKIAGIKSKVNSTNSWDGILDKTSAEKSCGFDSELIRKSSFVQFEELYQQFRLIVSNWLTSQKAGSEVRKGIEDIIFNSDLPDFEKRKRLYIYISATLLSWFYPDKEKWEAPASFLRKDCRLIDSPEGCTGTCFWKEEEGGGLEEGKKGKCLLHVDETTQLGEKPGERDVSTAELFTKRVIDELVRFPNRRKQLMRRGEISKVSTIVAPIRQGDQYIIPESSPTWTNLLRLDWARQIPEEPKYYEEMSREATVEDEQPPEGEMPESLEAILGEGTTLRLSIPDIPDKTQPLMPFTGILGVTLEQLGLDNNATIIKKENLIKYVQVTTKPIGLIDLRESSESLKDSVQFVKPFTGSFDSVTIFVFLPDQIGILIQEEGDSTVKISALPESIQELYKGAPVVQMKRRVILPPKEEEIKVPLIIGQNPIMAKLKRRPLVATTAQAPLVPAESKPVEEAKQPLKPRRRPIVAATAKAKEESNIKPNNKPRNTTKRKPRVAPVTNVAPVLNKE